MGNSIVSGQRDERFGKNCTKMKHSLSYSKKRKKLLRGRIKGREKAKIKVPRDISDRVQFHPLGLERINPHQFRKIVALVEMKMKVNSNL